MFSAQKAKKFAALLFLCLATGLTNVGASVRPENPFVDLTFEAALERAKSEEKSLLIVWTASEEADSKRFLAQFEDKQLREWLAKNVIALNLDGVLMNEEARGAGISTFPASIFIDPTDNVQRMLPGYLSAVEFMIEGDSLLHADVTVERPEGEAANDPMAWLAYGNHAYPDITRVHDALDAYLWCLDNGEKYMPGFRARYLNFLVKRIAYRKLNTARAKPALVEHRNMLADKLLTDAGTPELMREIMILNYWLRHEANDIKLFDRLRMGTDEQRLIAASIFEELLDRLVAGGRNDVVLQFGGDLVKRIRDRIETARAEDRVEAVRPTILNDASCFYEALMSEGRGADANELLNLVLTTYPIGRTYNAFIRRMIRLELYDEARALAAVGKEKLGDRAEKQINMALKKIPTKHGGPSGDAVLPEHVKARYEREAAAKEAKKRERAKRAGDDGGQR